MTFSALDWVLVGSAGLSACFLVFIALKKAPQLSIVDPKSSKEARAKERKQAVLEARVLRKVEEHRQKVWRDTLRPIVFSIRDGFRRLAGKLTALERRYAAKQREGKGIDAAGLRRMLEEARNAIANERFAFAENILISIVSHDPKHKDAYEMLGRMYLGQGQYAEAKEALEFLVKITPNDPSAMIALGEVYEALGEPKEAFIWFQKGKNASPNNPKYLDFFIRSAIAMGEWYEAQQAIDHLKEVNPENNSIATFELMLADARRPETSSKI